MDSTNAKIARFKRKNAIKKNAKINAPSAGGMCSVFHNLFPCFL